MKFQVYKDINCFGFKKDEEVFEVIDLLRVESCGFYSVAINAEKLISANNDKKFKKIVAESKLPVPDGIVAKFLIWKKFGFLSKRINLPFLVITYAKKNRLSLAVIGADEESNKKAFEHIKSQHTNLETSFRLNGYVKEQIIKEHILLYKPDCILLGLGSPKQEILSKKLINWRPNLIIINCGGAIDILSGLKKRAP